MGEKKIIITGNFRLDVEADEKEVFKVMKQFFAEQFQNYKISISGKTETLTDEFKRDYLGVDFAKEDKSVINGELVEKKEVNKMLG